MRKALGLCRQESKNLSHENWLCFLRNALITSFYNHNTKPKLLHPIAKEHHIRPTQLKKDLVGSTLCNRSVLPLAMETRRLSSVP